MKTRKYLTFAAVLTIFCIAGFASCTPKDVTRVQTATITDLFGWYYYATVKGEFTNAEWSDSADRIRIALNGAYQEAGEKTRSDFAAVFVGGDVTIIVETAQGYSSWKTINDGKTLYINIDKLDSLQSKLIAAITAMSNKTAAKD